MRRFRRHKLFVSPAVHVVRKVMHGQTVFFSVRNPKDAIQREHMSGAFYETEELEIIAGHFPVGGVFVDIGANVGNHTLYVAKFLHASKIFVFEPNPQAIDILESNIYLNEIEHICDRSFLGVGLSSKKKSGLSMRIPPRNLGGSRMVEGEGNLETYRGDELLGDVRPDMIKIDVEGMEIDVLHGLSGIIEQCSPKMFIEVNNENSEQFSQWLKTHSYKILQEYKRYRSNTNYLIAHV